MRGRQAGPSPSGTAGAGNATGLGGFGGSMHAADAVPGDVHRFPADAASSTATRRRTRPTIFGTPGSGTAGGPCVIEPQDNSLFPNNWLRPRFRFTAGAGLYEIRLHAANQANDLVVYTTNTTWTMDKAIWTGLAVHTRDMPIEVTVRSAPPGGGQVLIGSTVHFTIAPVGANGTLVYWSTSGTTYFNGQPTGTETVLNGFAVGDEGVVRGAAAVHGRHAAGRDADLRPGTEHAPGEVHRLPHLDARRVVHRVQRLLPLGRGARVGTSPAGAEPPASILGVGGRRCDHAAVGRDHQLLAGALGRRRPHHGGAARHLRNSACSRATAATAWTWTSSRAWPGSISRARPTPDINNLATSLRGHGVELDLRAGDGPLRGGAVVEPRRHARCCSR